jgi:hypothetical protein
MRLATRRACFAAFLAPLVSLLSGPLAAQAKPACTPFFSNSVYLNDQGPSVATGDFNGDGIPDLVALSNLTLNVYLGKGNGQFQPPKVFPTGGAWFTNVAIGDFNHDGKLDVAVSVPETDTTGTVNVLLGNGDGTFQSPISSPVYGYTFFLAVGHFNHDGNLDLAAISTQQRAPYVVQVLLGNGDGTFQPAVDYSVGGQNADNPAEIAVADFNGDGHLDLAVTNVGIMSNPGHTVSVLLGNGDGTFQARKTYQTGNGPQGIAVADFNGDGDMDIATANGIDGTVSVLLGRGDGAFRPAATYQAGHPLEAPTTLAAVQFDGDGKPGLAVASPTGTFVLANKGDGTLRAALGYDPAALQVVTADFNGDGMGDLALVAAASNEGASVSSFTVLLGKGHGVFPTSTAYSVLGSPGAAAVGDFNGDGIPDLAVASQATGALAILLGTGNGGFANWQTENVYLLSQPTAVAVGDVNGDGKLDLVVVDSDGGKLQVLLGNGDGTFTVGPKFSPGGPNPYAIVLADFNGDGILDIAVARTAPEALDILAGNGDGTFRKLAGYEGGQNYVLGLAAADFNGDGKPDLAVTKVDYASGGLTDPALEVFLGNGDGTFQAPLKSPLPAEPFGFAVADFNGDGVPDVAAILSTNEIQILLGRGNGAFRMGATVTTMPGRGGVAAADFNGDGKADLAYSATDASFLQMFPGKGDGTFGAPINTLTGVTPFAPIVAGLSGVGAADLVLPNYGSGTVSVLLNRCSK